MTRQCGVCWQDINKKNIIKAGCCSFVCCLNCIKKLDKCPQCKKEYFWISKNDINFEEEINKIKKEYDELNLLYNELGNFINEEREWWANKLLENKINATPYDFIHHKFKTEHIFI